MQTQSKVLKWGLIFGIVIVLNLFFNYSLSLIYKQPNYNVFCPPTEIYPPSPANAECQNAFQAAQNAFERNIFSVLIILGALCVLLGNFFKGNEVISNALSLGGVFSFIIASMRYWGNADDFTHVLILAIALCFLIWIAVKKFKNQA